MPQEHITASIGKEVVKKTKQQAKKEKRSFSNMLEVMAETYIKEHADTK